MLELGGGSYWRWGGKGIRANKARTARIAPKQCLSSYLQLSFSSFFVPSNRVLSLPLPKWLVIIFENNLHLNTL